jgi:hypothetical protein
MGGMRRREMMKTTRERGGFGFSVAVRSWCPEHWPSKNHVERGKHQESALKSIAQRAVRGDSTGLRGDGVWRMGRVGRSEESRLVRIPGRSSLFGTARLNLHFLKIRPISSDGGHQNQPPICALIFVACLERNDTTAPVVTSESQSPAKE